MFILFEGLILLLIKNSVGLILVVTALLLCEKQRIPKYSLFIVSVLMKSGHTNDDDLKQ